MSLFFILHLAFLEHLLFISYIIYPLSSIRSNLDQVIAGRTCNKGWSYTRVIQYEFVGAANEEIRDVQSRFSNRLILYLK